jgi:hypothetical protein
VTVELQKGRRYRFRYLLTARVGNDGTPMIT